LIISLEENVGTGKPGRATATSPHSNRKKGHLDIELGLVDCRQGKTVMVCGKHLGKDVDRIENLESKQSAPGPEAP
jgi:hypothetical protein